MVDAADTDKLEASRNELHSLIDKPQLAGIPVLVLGNKRDLPNALDEVELIDRMYVYILCINIAPKICSFITKILSLDNYDYIKIKLGDKTWFFCLFQFYDLKNDLVSSI